MTSQYNTAEGGTNGVTPTTSDTGSGAALGKVTAGTVSTVKYSSTDAAHGGLGYKLANNTATSEAATIGQLDSGGGAASVFGSFYYTCDVSPTTTLRVVRFRKNLAGIVGSLFETSSGFLQIRQGSDANPPVYTFTNALTAGTTYRIEWNVIAAASTTATIQARLYLGDSGTLIEDSAAQSVTATASVSAVDLVEYGGGVTASAHWPNSGTGSQYFDDLKAFYTDWTGAVATAGVSITGVAAAATAGAGAFTLDVTLTDTAAVATASAVAPTVGTSKNLTITAAAAASTAAATAPAFRIDASLVVAVGRATAAFGSPSFSSTSGVTVAADVCSATATPAGPAATLTLTAGVAAGTAAIVAPRLELAMLPGAITATAGPAAPAVTVAFTIAATFATATADFPAPRVAAAEILAAALIDAAVMRAAIVDTGVMVAA